MDIPNKAEVKENSLFLALTMSWRLVPFTIRRNQYALQISYTGTVDITFEPVVFVIHPLVALNDGLDLSL